MSKEYPVEIYPKPNERIKDSAERIYDLGFRDGRFKERLEASNPLAGWSNLTEAIKDKARIDWERLDGVEAKCVHPELGTLTHKLERDEKYIIDSVVGWYKSDYNSAWSRGLGSAWCGHDGWSLWVKGDLPLRKQTADELEPGTCFAARHNKGEYTQSYSYAQLVKADGQKPMVVCYSRYLTDIFATIDPKEVEVIDIYGEGTFEKPEGDA